MIFDPNESNRLRGAHATFYRESLATMLDVFREALYDREFEPIWVFGVEMFDGLQWQQQMSLLIAVSSCVLDGKGSGQEWGALEKATFYAVYRNVFQHLEMERDMDSMDRSIIELPFGDDDLDFDLDEEDDVEPDSEEQSWKELIEAAYRERCEQEGLSQQEIDASIEPEGGITFWESLLETLADRILEDRDFEMASTFLDADPAVASAVKKELGISHDYFIATGDEPTREDEIQLFRDLSKLADVPMPAQFIDDQFGDEHPF